MLLVLLGLRITFGNIAVQRTVKLKLFHEFFLGTLQGGDIEKATDWIFNNPDASVSSDMDTSTSSSKPTPDDTELPDGGGSEFLNPCFHYIDCKHMILKCFTILRGCL
jgi:hypothetical protein